jgi:hypothetical protein
MAAFTARYPGTCLDCDQPIEVGDMIRPDAGGDGFVHAHPCSPDRVEEAQVCTTCWLTTCDCGRDT